MQDAGLWKYCGKEQQREFILSLDLIKAPDWSDEKKLACLYAVSNHTERHYHKSSIPKKHGGRRELLEPDRLLKQIQHNILHHILEGFPVSVYASGYRKHQGLLENVASHTGKRQILKLDIEDFFGSISFGMVYRYGFPGIYFPPSVRTLLTYLCCYLEYLPQGAPTSPCLSNLVMKPFDDYMGAWCGERGISYTRYCDDMTFSGDFSAGPVIKKVSAFLDQLGFTLNEKKTKVISCHQRQNVTGITVNDRPQVPSDYRRKLRQEIYYCLKYGAENHMKQAGLSPEPQREEAIRYLSSLLGKINFVLQINRDDKYFKEMRGNIKEQIALLSSEI